LGDNEINWKKVPLKDGKSNSETGQRARPWKKRKIIPANLQGCLSKWIG
jgi:hypothetical protein